MEGLKKTKLLKPQINTSGYYFVTLCAGGLKKQISVHVLVLEGFVGPRPSKDHEASHLDGNNKNNKLPNLEWQHRLENNQLKIAHGTSRPGEQSHLSKLKNADIEYIRKTYQRGVHGEFSSRGLAKKFGVTRGAISSVVNNKTWKCLL